MAITEIEYHLTRALREKGVLPLGGDVLELGQANWYGDVGVDVLIQDIDHFAPEAAREGMKARLGEIVAAGPPYLLFEIADIFWQAMLQPSSLTAIDLHGTARALKLDLNEPIDLGRRFDLVLNFGTLEHVFNVAQAIKTIHEHTQPGGLMVHGMPFSGWLDHGFYSFNPTFYWDLAAANGYEIVTLLFATLEPLRMVRMASREEGLALASKGGLGTNPLIYAVFRRPVEARPFRPPIQGYYAGATSDEVTEAWRTLR